MKIKTIRKTYKDVMALKSRKSYKPVKPNIFWRTLLKIVSLPDLMKVKFKYEKIDMNRLDKKEPALILMNHSSFIDLEIAASIFYPRPLNIITTNDAFIGKNWLMRQIGCVATPKFVNDPTVVRKIARSIKAKTSVLMFPEAGYSFDGTATTFPIAVAKLAKFLKIPVISVITDGAYLRQPLYNELRRRKVKVSAKVKYLLSKDEIIALSDEKIFDKICNEFSFDNFKNQQQNGVIINEEERAVGLNKILYKCPHCMAEGKIITENNKIICTACKAKYELNEIGYLKSTNRETKFTHIPDWYQWEREEVRKEIVDGKYNLDEEVDILMMKDTYSIYDIGSGRLTHNVDGFHLTGCDGELDFSLSSINCYSVNADFYWYQIGDTISIGDYDKQFYCFPKSKEDLAAKTRLATEEIYKILKGNKR